MHTRIGVKRVTVSQLSEKLNLKVVAMYDPDREVEGAYAGDLLSWVMGNASEGNAFVTIMTNINVIAVATLIDMSCVIFCEGVEIPQEVLDAAAQKEVNLLSSPLPSFEMCGELYGVLK